MQELRIGDVAFTVFFVLDVVVRILVLRCKFWAVPMNYIDIAVSMTSLLEIVLFYVASANLAVNPILFRLLRIGKLARAIRMITMNLTLTRVDPASLFFMFLLPSFKVVVELTSCSL